MKSLVVLRVIAKLFFPLILIFALYVQFHGDYGPGGGFQAGVIFATGFILYAMVFGLDAATRVIAPGLLRVLMAVRGGRFRKSDAGRQLPGIPRARR